MDCSAPSSSLLIIPAESRISRPKLATSCNLLPLTIFVIEDCGPGVSPLDKAEIFLYLANFRPLCWQYQSASFSLTASFSIASFPFKS